MGNSFCRQQQPDYDGEVQLHHFHLLRVVGKGAFGKVRIVRYKKTDKIYALKYIDKNKAIKMKAADNIIQERRLLEEISSRFVCNLRFAFQDDEYLFMVIDLMLGGDLRFHLDKMRVVDEKLVKFFVAEISCALSHLHSMNIVHRDLKPDNILLDEYGHCHLTDFNIATHFRPGKPLTAIAGSMAYMAPEILSKKGYYTSIDWWSLGVVIFELLFGKRPFRAKTNSALTAAILSAEPVFPVNVNEIITPECLDFLQKLLTRDITHRIGTLESGGMNVFRAHPWFNDINWNILETKNAKPPFVPDSKGSNFDATHELVELFIEDKPLRSKSNKKKRNSWTGSSTPEDRPVQRAKEAMEEKYLVYDHSKPAGYKSYHSGHMPVINTIPVAYPAPAASPPSSSPRTNESKRISRSSTGNTYRLSQLSPTTSLHKDIMEGRDNEVSVVGQLESAPSTDVGTSHHSQ